MIDLGLHYKYIYFNSCYLKRGHLDGDEYNAICLRDAENVKDVVVVATPLQQYPPFIRRLYALHTSQRLNSRVKVPLQRLWYPAYFSTDSHSDKPYCFIVACNNISMDYLRYLRSKYPDSRFVKVHRDLLKVLRNNPDYTEENMNRVFDLRFTYDEGEAKKYGLLHFDEIESKIDVPISDQYPLSDVFFAGRAKERFPDILAAYKVLSEYGLKCDFYITDVPKDAQIQLPGITYANSFMLYKDMLYKTVNSRCLLDVNQQGAVGYTSRVLEAIMYNKRIILNNESIKSSKYYTPEYMQVVDDMSKIDPSFVTREDVIDYEYEGEFSPIHLIKQIDNELFLRYGK